jgi:hypothetical protein
MGTSMAISFGGANIFPTGLAHGSSYLYMAGSSNGYTTEFQQNMKGEADTDTFVHRVAKSSFADIELLSADYTNCPHHKTFHKLTTGGAVVTMQKWESALYTKLYQGDQSLPSTDFAKPLFDVQYSKYLQHTKLKAGVMTPRPCSHESVTLSEKPL